MTADLWIEFKNDVTTFLKDHTSTQPTTIRSEQELNRQWHILNQAIKQAANQHIPQAKIAFKTYYAFFKNATKLHAALQKINMTIRILKNNLNPDLNLITTVNSNITNINKLANLDIPQMSNTPESTATIQDYIIILKQHQKTIYQARKLENNLAHKHNIDKHITKRYNNFMTNTTSMISSVLQRHTDPVILHNITYSNYITTEPSEIKKEIKQHFENWTKPNPINNNH